MASITKRPNEKWRARHRCQPGTCSNPKHVAHGGEHAKDFARKVDAQRWVKELDAAVVVGNYVDPSSAHTTVSQWCDAWLEGYASHRASTVRTAKIHIARIKKEFGAMPLSAVRSSQVKSWVAKMKVEGYAPSTVHATYRRLAQLMGDAVDDGLIPKSPCTRKTAPPMGAQKPYVATSDQVWALYEEVAEHYRPAILLGAFAGLRISEAAGLRIKDVDFMRGIITPAVQYNGEPLKTEGSGQPIPIPQDLALMLSAAVKIAMDKTGGEATHVVTTQVGQPTSPSGIDRAVRAARSKVEGMSETFTHHDLRHHYASTLIEAGLSVKVVQQCLRHQSATTTLNTYSHLFPGADESARTAVGTAISARADILRTLEA